jgi:riboflavin kinase / FMN adenylyltransferase
MSRATPLGAVVTVGTFDGVHLGHRAVLDRLAAQARASGLRSVLVTFDPHPLEVVNPAAAPPLLTVGLEKSEVLAESAVEHVVVLPFTPALAALSAERFVDEVLIARVGMRALLIGHDHGFGRGRGGNVDVLRGLAAARGFGLDVLSPVASADGRAVSSTAIRRAVAGGDLARAAAGLGRPYAIAGRVVAGAGRGRTLGYRTLNLAPVSARKLLPPDGVYVVRVQTPAGAFGGMMNLGGRPTFGDESRQLEAHLFDAEADLYGAWVRVDLLARLRGVERFASPAALVAQLAVDEAAARARLADGP